jgi:hypothetical protein
MSSEREVIKKGLTPRAFIIGASLSVAITVWMTIWSYTISHLFSGYDYVVGSWTQPSPYNLFWANGLWIFLIISLISAVLPGRFRLTPQELSVILTMVIITLPLVTNWHEVAYSASFCYGLAAGGGWLSGEFEKMLLWLEPWWVQTNAYPAAKNLYQNGGIFGRPISVAIPIDWSIHIPWMTWHMLQIITLGCLGLFLAAIIRKQYVEIEALPFPNAVAATTILLGAATSSARPRIFSNKWMWLGVLISQILVIPGWIYLLGRLTGFDTTAFKFNTSPKYDLIIPFIPIALVWVAPWILGFGTLMPTEFLISYFITWIVFVVGIANIEWMIGLFTPPPATATMSWYVSRITTYLIVLNPPGIGMNGVVYGITLAAALYPLWAHRRHVIATIKAIWKKPSAEFEQNEALPYKWLYVGAIVSFIAYLILFAITPAAPTLWIIAIFIILALVWFMGGARLIASAGMGGKWTEATISLQSSPNQWMNRTIVAWIWGRPKPGGEPENAMFAFHVQGAQGYWLNRAMNSFPTPILLDCFKVAEITKTRSRDILIAGIVALIIPAILGNPIHVWLDMQANWRMGPGQNSWTAHDAGYSAILAARGTPYGWRGYWYMGYPQTAEWPDLPGLWTLIIGGLVFGWLCFWLRTRYPSFIYTPLSIIFWFSGLNADMWFFLLIVAFVIKYLIIRTFGVLYYEQKIVPMAVGLIVGGMIYMWADGAYYWLYGRVFI